MIPDPDEPGQVLEDPEESSEELEDHEEAATGLRRGVYFIPNLITTGALFAGFFAIVAGMSGSFAVAGFSIFIAMVLDVLDGRIARLTHSESEFGAQYDSLSDMVAFGVAPAVVVFHWGLSSLKQVGWVVTFIFMACAALRLARFNISGDVKSFVGLPSPMAAGVIASAVWIWTDMFESNPSTLSVSLMSILVVLVGLLMVSNIKYYSPKLFHVKGRVPFLTLVLVVIVLSVIFADPPLVLFVVAGTYLLSGPAMFLWDYMPKQTFSRPMNLLKRKRSQE